MGLVNLTQGVGAVEVVEVVRFLGCWGQQSGQRSGGGLDGVPLSSTKDRLGLMWSYNDS